MSSTPNPLDKLSLPVSALSALERKGVLEISDLSSYTEEEISSLNGVGRKAIMVLQDALQQHNMCFKKTK